MDFINGFFMIISAITGALITLIGQVFKERYMKSRLDFRICAKSSEKEDKLRLYLVVENDGYKSTNEVRTYIRRSCKSGKITKCPTIVDLPYINPKGSLICDLGYVDMKTSQVMLYEQGGCEEGDTNIVHIIVSSYDLESVAKTYTLSETFLKNLDELPDEGIEAVWIWDAELRQK